jgi:hypothetical protein
LGRRRGPQAHGELGEERLGERDGAATRRGQGRDDGCRHREVGVDVVQEAVLVGLREAVDLDAREVAATEGLEVGGEIAQEVDLLERRTEGASTGDHALLLGGVELLPLEEGLEAHEADDLGGAVDVAVEARLVVLLLAQVHAHRLEEGGGELGAESDLAGGQGERVDDEVRAEPGVHRVLGLPLELVERATRADRVEPRLRRGAVDDLVGHPHERVDVLDVLAHPRPEEPGGEAEGGRVTADHDTRRLLRDPVVEGEA